MTDTKWCVLLRDEAAPDTIAIGPFDSREEAVAWIVQNIKPDDQRGAVPLRLGNPI